MARSSKYHKAKMYEKYGVFAEAKQYGFTIIKEGNAATFKKGNLVIRFQ